MFTLRNLIESQIVRAPFTVPHKGDEVFPGLDAEWCFGLEAPVTVPVVCTPDGLAVVGEADASGILWRAGCAYVLVDGDARKARENSVSYTPKCRAGKVSTKLFRIVRGFGKTPILCIKYPVIAA